MVPGRIVPPPEGSLQRELENESRDRYQSPYHQALIALGLGIGLR